MKQRVSIRSVRNVINKNFTFADLSPKYVNVDSSTGNIFCPFHENHTTPAAKMYWDENRQMWVIWCFTEKTHYTAFDYVNKILCQKYERYRSPLQFLEERMPKGLLHMQLEASEKEQEDQVEMETSAKVEYIQKIAEENESTEDFIEALYLG